MRSLQETHILSLPTRRIVLPINTLRNLCKYSTPSSEAVDCVQGRPWTASNNLNVSAAHGECSFWLACHPVATDEGSAIAPFAQSRALPDHGIHIHLQREFISLHLQRPTRGQN